MDSAKKFGEMIVDAAKTDPDKAAKLLVTGNRINVAMSFAPDPKISPCRRYGSRIVSKSLVTAFAHPERTAMVSIFIPCEPLAAAGITPLSVEAFSGVCEGTYCEQYFLDKTKEDGEPETLCSFHRTFHGAMSAGVLKPPSMLIYTNLACDANMVGFPYVIDRYKIPGFFVEVPYERSQESVKYVAEQLKEMVTFIEDTSGKKISEEKLKLAIARGRNTSRYYRESLKYTGHHALKGPTESEMYGVYTGHILMGTKESEKYSRLTLRDVKKAPDNDAVKVVWIHMTPFILPSINSFMGYSKKLRITANDLVYDCMFEVEAEDPYEAMATRMVYSIYNGDYKGRLERAIEAVRLTEADGVVLFAHWGCKTSFGAASLYQKGFEEAGIPFLMLNGDGGDPSNCADGQIATRLGAFVEMLERNRK